MLITNKGLLTFHLYYEKSNCHIGVTKLKYLLRPVCVWPAMSKNTSFRSDVFADFFCKSNITHYFFSTYYPQGNGVVERLHETMKQTLQKLLYERRDFSESLQQVLFDIRSTAHS